MDALGTRRAALLASAAATPGFLPEDEALALCELARLAGSSGLGPLLEVGAYLGRSSLYLAAGLLGSGAVLYSVDHHHGSEEMQSGWEHHDPALVGEDGAMETLHAWRRAIVGAGAEDLVVGVIGESSRVAANWATPLSLVFIDGGHAEAACRADYLGFAPALGPGGLLAFHDVFPEGRGGGEAPWRCYLEACASGEFAPEPTLSCGSLAVARRVASSTAVVAAPPASASRARSAAAAE
jgi:predicted O-methyltransferase YrrM